MGQNKNCLSQARVRIFVVFAYLPIDGIVQMQVITIKTGPLISYIRMQNVECTSCTGGTCSG